MKKTGSDDTNNDNQPKGSVRSRGASAPSYHQIVERSPNMVAYLDSQWRYRLVNSAYADWFKVDQQHFVGKTIDEVHKQGFANALAARLRQALLGAVINFQVQAKHHSGELRWVEASFITDTDENGGVQGVYVYIRDISERKKEEGCRALLQLALDQGMEGFSLHDKNGYCTYVNDSQAEMYGYTAKELLGRHWGVVYSEQQVKYVREVCVPILEKKGQWRGELVGLKKDGSCIDTEVSMTLLTDKSKNPVGLVCNCRDITEKKKAEQELRQAATVFESAAEGVVITDSQFRVIAVNSVYTALTGYSEASVVGKLDEELYSLEYTELTLNAIRRTLGWTGKWQGEIYHKRHQKDPFPTWQTIAPVTDNEGHIKSYVIVLDDISQLKLSQQRLHQMAHYDHLTGLPNRILLNKRLAQALRKADSSGYQVAVLFLDLDNFKHINDTQGHIFGDKLLTATAQRIVEACRDDDVIARAIGDEFIIVIERLKHSSMAARLAEKLLDKFSAPLMIDALEYYQGVSIGVSTYPKDGRSVDELIRHADTAMHKAKTDGRHTFRFYDESMSKWSQQHVNLNSQLHKALDQSQFILHYQPFVKADSLQVVGMEALIRWQHPEWGLTYPDKFIPYVENSKLIVQIGGWVLQESCRQAKAWLDQGLTFERISVNVSGNQLRSNFVEEVTGILRQTCLFPEQLELELTETYLMADFAEPISILRELSDMGITIAIDDFGVGYSSLSRLKELPIQRLKIDRSFIRDIHSDPNDWSIVQAIIAMSQSLGLEVTAEGVETDEHHQLLASYNNIYAQGYYFAKPAPAEQIPTLIDAIHALRNQ